MSQRVTTKTGRRKKKVKSSSSSSSSTAATAEVIEAVIETPETISSSTNDTDNNLTSDVIDEKIEIELLKNEDSTLVNNEEEEEDDDNDNDNDDDNNSKKKTKELNIIDDIVVVPDIIGIPESFFLIEEPKYSDIDGSQVRSAIFSSKRWPIKVVSFPDNDNNIVTGYHEPANPWRHAEDVSRDLLLTSYKNSCERHCVEPLKKVLDQLETLDIDSWRCNELLLDHENLEKSVCEPLEEIFKRIQFIKINLECSNLEDESAETLFDMIEYYESAKSINISGNVDIGARGWTSCAQMIRKTTSLEQLEARDIVLTQVHINILKKPLQLVSHLRILKLENCSLAGRAFVIFIGAIKFNTGIRELHLADNNFDIQDGILLGTLLRMNNGLQLLDISNNKVKDEGVKHILEAIASQSEGDDGALGGLRILVLWNNHLTKNSAPYFSLAIEKSQSLETINMGQNIMTDDTLERCKDALKKNTCLLQLGMQSTGLLLAGLIALAEVVDVNKTLQRIDLRDNNIQLTGLTYLSLAVKKNTTVTQIDLDDKTWSKSPALIEPYFEQVVNIRDYCKRNAEEPSSSDTEDTTSTETSATTATTTTATTQQHRSRLSSINSRKISLTCQTLPRSPPALSNADYINNKTNMLEPKRGTGERLRSPAPSPIPSPVASPIPSPSRSRFVVSRVSETSLSSTNSSASSSPITPPSITSSSSLSSTCFFPSSSSSSSSSTVTTTTTTTTTIVKKPSRFRVTIVEPNTNNNSTIKNTLNTINKRINSDDSDSVFRDDDVDDELLNDKSPNNIDNTIPIIDKNKITKNNNNNNNSPVLLSSVLMNNNKTTTTTNNADDDDNNKLIKQDNNPKQTSSLERLLGLFQHPGNLFTSTLLPTSEKNNSDVKNSIQGSVNSMIALGDKFQQLLRQDSTTMSLQKTTTLENKNNEQIKLPFNLELSSLHSTTNREINNHLDNNLIVHKNNETSDEDCKLHDETNIIECLSTKRDFNIDEINDGIERINITTNDDDDDDENKLLENEAAQNNDVPVLTNKIAPSEFKCEDNDEDNNIKNNTCDSTTKDSINKCINIKMASVCSNNNDKKQLNTNIEDEKNQSVQKKIHHQETNDGLLINYEKNNNNNNNNTNGDENKFIINNNNQVNDIDNDVKDIMTSILDIIPDIIDKNLTTHLLPDKLHHNNCENINIDDKIVNNYVNETSSHTSCNKSVELIVDSSNSSKSSNNSGDTSDDNDKKILNDNGVSKIVYENLTDIKISEIDCLLLEPNTSVSSNNLIIDNTINKHRNSQDSGIEETNLSLNDDGNNYGGDLTTSLQPINSFRESVDSGFDSECSTVYNKCELLTTDTARNNDIPILKNHDTCNKLNNEDLICHGFSNIATDEIEVFIDLKRLDDDNDGDEDHLEINDEQINSNTSTRVD